ncbi:MAG: hypothetical protein H6538_04385 [Bacteroidales bacterium]|nr:hypothetical protein [Bacteroidales bacterium]MCB8999857.1 hypothetical protein [Bacteroidales bacterium]
MRTIIQIALALAIVILSYLVYESIMTPIRFNKQKNIRERKTIVRLLEIRDSQKAYKDAHLQYTSSFDTLIEFLKNDSFSVVKAIGMIPETLLDSVGLKKAKEIALERGIIKREVTRISVLDSLFGKSFNVDSLRYVPFADTAQFKMVADQYVTPSNLTVKVLEVSVPYSVLLNGLDPQLVINYADERKKITNFPGLKLGSLTEGTLTGNWE